MQGTQPETTCAKVFWARMILSAIMKLIMKRRWWNCFYILIFTSFTSTLSDSFVSLIFPHASPLSDKKNDDLKKKTTKVVPFHHRDSATRIPSIQGTIGCTPNSVTIVIIVFSRDSWGYLTHKYPLYRDYSSGFPIGVRWDRGTSNELPWSMVWYPKAPGFRLVLLAICGAPDLFRANQPWTPSTPGVAIREARWLGSGYEG